VQTDLRQIIDEDKGWNRYLLAKFEHDNNILGSIQVGSKLNVYVTANFF